MLSFYDLSSDFSKLLPAIIYTVGRNSLLRQTDLQWHHLSVEPSILFSYSFPDGSCERDAGKLFLFLVGSDLYLKIFHTVFVPIIASEAKPSSSLC